MPLGRADAWYDCTILQFHDTGEQNVAGGIIEEIVVLDQRRFPLDARPAHRSQVITLQRCAVGARWRLLTARTAAQRACGRWGATLAPVQVVGGQRAGM